MVLLLSDEWTWFVAIMVVAGVVGALFGSGFDDMKEHPWKYRKVFEANEAKKKAKEQAKDQDNH